MRFGVALCAPAGACVLSADGTAAAPDGRHWPKRAGVPCGMERTYERVGQRFGVDARLLAAIGLGESRHGARGYPACSRA